MAGVIKEYRCSDCTRIFDSSVPSCIHCGSTNVQRIFITPFSFKGDKTKSTDDHLEHFAKSYKLSDISNNQNTKHEPERASTWMSPKDAAVSSLLPTVQGGSFPVKDLKERAPGRYETISHKQDVK